MKSGSVTMTGAGLIFLMFTICGGVPLNDSGLLNILELSDVPWAKTENVTNKSCNKYQCKIQKYICENGGVCVLDEENCRLTCKCPLGYTGVFCGLKTLSDVTTLSMYLTTTIKQTLSTLSTPYRNSKQASRKRNKSSTQVPESVTERTTAKSEQSVKTKKPRKGKLLKMLATSNTTAT